MKLNIIVKSCYTLYNLIEDYLSQVLRSDVTLTSQMTTHLESSQNCMVIQYKSINKIRFPVYAMPSGNWYRQDGLLFLDDKILDDRNMGGDTLGIRRLQTPYKNLQELHHQLDNFRGILKSRSKYFVDSYGIPFIYEKSEFCKLIGERLEQEGLESSQLHGTIKNYVTKN